MTKAEIVSKISEKTGIEKMVALTVIEALMNSVKQSVSEEQSVYLRGFGSFIPKKRAEKTGRNISKNTTIIIPAHFVPAFKPAQIFMDKVRKNVLVKQD